MVRSAYKNRAAVKPPYRRSSGSILHKVLFLCLCQCLGLERLARAQVPGLGICETTTINITPIVDTDLLINASSAQTFTIVASDTEGTS